MLEGIIVGGGISGLALAHFLGLHEGPEMGAVGSRRSPWRHRRHRPVRRLFRRLGPNGFLDREPLTLRLVSEIGLDGELEPANPASANRFIAMKQAPSSRAAFAGFHCSGRGCSAPARSSASSRSLSSPHGGTTARSPFSTSPPGASAGVLRRPSWTHGFRCLRRPGTRALPAGVLPGDARAGTPLRGLVRGMIGRVRERRRNPELARRRKSGGPAGPGGWLTSFRGGMDALVRRLQGRLQPILRSNQPVCRITRLGDAWEVTGASGQRATARSLVLACPAFAAAGMLGDFDAQLSAALASIPYAAIAVVASGHRREDIAHPLDGFGFLIPRSQGLRTLGSIWTSSIFAERAPEGYVQFRSMLGGAGDSAAVELSDDRLWATLRRELDPFLGIRRDPAFLRVYRWERGIPQFTLGHRERRARIESMAARHPGLYLLGNAYYGVSLNDCVKMAHRLAGEIIRVRS